MARCCRARGTRCARGTRVLTAGPLVVVAWPAPVRQWAREEPGHRGTTALQSLQPRPCPTKAAITVTSRDSLAWRHRAGWGHPLGNPEPEVSCFWASLRTGWIQGGTVQKLCPSPTESWCLHTREPWTEDAVSKQSMKSAIAL